MPSAAFDPIEMRTSFDETMRVLSKYVWSPTIKELRPAARNNETRCFQIKVAKPDAPEATSKGLRWKVVGIRAIFTATSRRLHDMPRSPILCSRCSPWTRSLKSRLNTNKITRTYEDQFETWFGAGAAQRDATADLFTIVVIAWQWRKSSSTNSSLVVGQRGWEGLTIAWFLLTHGMWDPRSSREREPVSSFTWLSTLSWAFKVDAVSSAPMRLSRALTGCRMNASCLPSTAWIVSLPGWIVPMSPPAIYNALMKNHREKQTPKGQALVTPRHDRTWRRFWKRRTWFVKVRCAWPHHQRNCHHPSSRRCTWTLRRPSDSQDGFLWSFAQRREHSKRERTGQGKRTPSGRVGGIFNNKIEVQQVKKFQSCFKCLVAWFDGRIATKVCRLESTAKRQMVLLHWTRLTSRSSHEARECQTEQLLTSAEREGAILATWGMLPRLMLAVMPSLVSHPLRTEWKEIHTISSTTPCCQFLELVAKCLSPDLGRSRESREKQLGTRLLFMPDEKRDIRKPLDVTNEAMIAHTARDFSHLPSLQFSLRRLPQRRGHPRHYCMDGPGQSFPSTKARRRIAFSTWWTLPNDNGQNSSTTSKASSTALSPLLPPVMSPTSHWQGVPSTLTKERGSGGTLIPAHVLRRAAVKGSFRDRFFSRLSSAGTGQYGHRSFECPSRLDRRWNWQSG